MKMTKIQKLATARRTVPPDPVPARILPDRRFELRVAGCFPVVLTSDTYFAKSALKHWQIARLFAVYGRYFGLPSGGRFLEDGQEFVFEAPASAPDPHFAIPRRAVISGERLGN
jgi:hypothetical protein